MCVFKWFLISKMARRSWPSYQLIDHPVYCHLAVKADSEKHSGTVVEPALDRDALDEGAWKARQDTTGPRARGRDEGRSRRQSPQFWPSRPLPNSSLAPKDSASVLG